jgi:hypothetical protein
MTEVKQGSVSTTTATTRKIKKKRSRTIANIDQDFIDLVNTTNNDINIEEDSSTVSQTPTTPTLAEICLPPTTLVRCLSCKKRGTKYEMLLKNTVCMQHRKNAYQYRGQYGSMYWSCCGRIVDVQKVSEFGHFYPNGCIKVNGHLALEQIPIEPSNLTIAEKTRNFQISTGQYKPPKNSTYYFPTENSSPFSREAFDMAEILQKFLGIKTKLKREYLLLPEELFRVFSGTVNELCIQIKDYIIEEEKTTPETTCNNVYIRIRECTTPAIDILPYKERRFCILLQYVCNVSNVTNKKQDITRRNKKQK